MRTTSSQLLCRIVSAIMVLQTGHAAASTEQERAFTNAPPPHELYGRGGVMVKVHCARMDGYSGTVKSNSELAAGLKKQVSECVKHGRNAALKPATEFPTYFHGDRTDEYVAANRRIKYFMAVGYGVNINTCGLLTVPIATAELISSKGTCTIDLVKKFAKGQCDANGFADAPIPPRPNRSPDALIERLAANPATAATAAQMKAMAEFVEKNTGEQRIVVGVRCNVWRHKVRDSNAEASACYAIGGSFVAPTSDPDGGPGGLVIESDWPNTSHHEAIDAKMDTEVSSSVFTPYTGAGFTIDRGDQ